LNSIIKQYIKADLYRVRPGQLTYLKLVKALRAKGFKFMFFFRLREHSNPLVSWPSKIITRILMYRYGFQIPSATQIGGGFFIGHFGPVVISAQCKIGQNCNIAHCCTLGAARGKRSGAPQVGDFVWIGTGAVLVGNIKIDDHVLIAPNAYVNFDVPAHSVVIGNPAKIISKTNPTKHYINNAWID
jgi:serine O-acetyltransferase